MGDKGKGLEDPKDKCVLVVEDEKDIREFLAEVIRKEGFQVRTVSDGHEALKEIDASHPDLILTDLMLPNYGGFEVLRRLQRGDAAGIPVVVITGRYTDSSTAELIRRESNVVEFLGKPVEPETLTNALHKVLKTKAPA